MRKHSLFGAEESPRRGIVKNTSVTQNIHFTPILKYWNRKKPFFACFPEHISDF
jgi:hypothetical protein